MSVWAFVVGVAGWAAQLALEAEGGRIEMVPRAGPPPPPGKIKI